MKSLLVGQTPFFSLTVDFLSLQITQIRDPDGSIQSSSSSQEVYYIGIIDTLTEYNLKKITEHTFKKLLYNANEISAIPPRPYRQRFLKYVSSILD